MRRVLLGLLVATIVLIAGAAFFAEQEIPREQLIAKYGAPPSLFVMLPSGTTAHYRERGSRGALTLILLPAMNDSLHQWEQWSEILSDQFRIVTVELPGQGLTATASDEDYSYERTLAFVDEFASALELERFALGGNSFGGLIAALYAIANPERVTHLVLVSAAGIETAESRPPTAMQIAQTPVLRELLRLVPMRGAFEGYLKEAIFDDRLVTAPLVDRYWELNRGRASVQLRRLEILGERAEAEDRFLRDNLGRVAVPALVLGGQEDRGSPPANARIYAASMPAATLTLYDGVSHFAMIEVPQQSAADVRAFLEGRTR